MTEVNLTYFDIDGGRAEPLRILLHMGGIEFTDTRISFSDFGKSRGTYPLKAVPVIDVNGASYTQTNAMCRYFGKQTGLYPSDPWQGYLCDEIMETVEDALHFIVRTFGLKDDELLQARQKLVDDRLTPYLKMLAERLEQAGGVYFTGNDFSIADLKMFIWIRGLRSGMLEHVPADLVDKVAPTLAEHAERVAAHSGVVDYYANRG